MQGLAPLCRLARPRWQGKAHPGRRCPHRRAAPAGLTGRPYLAFFLADFFCLALAFALAFDLPDAAALGAADFIGAAAAGLGTAAAGAGAAVTGAGATAGAMAAGADVAPVWAAAAPDKAISAART